MRRSPWILAVVLLLAAKPAWADAPSRAEAVAIGRSFAEHRWIASERNIWHGRDAQNIEVHTPDISMSADLEAAGLWTAAKGNVGIPYKWGGFDTIASFDAGIRAGKPAGDLYNAEKRRLGDKAVSAAAKGIDCSGFISRCWKLPKKYGTSTLPAISIRLRTAADLLPGDIMNVPAGHVLLFVRWLDGEKSRALFYEADPYSKVVASEREIAALTASGFHPLRYSRIRD